MRPAVFWAHVKMMPRIEAEEALADIRETAAGSGVMEAKDQRELTQELTRTADPERRHVVKASAKSLKQLGIEIVGDAE